MPVIETKSGQFDIIETGEGRPLLLLHSLLADRAIFDRVVPMLATERRVILPDLPGFGGSSPAGATVEAIADRVSEIFEALALSPECDVLGNGFGGFIASSLAIRHGHRFDRLVLADTGLGFDEAGSAQFHGMAARARQGGMEAVVDVAMKRLFPEQFIAANPELMAERRAALVRTNPDFFGKACEALAALDLRAQAGRIRNPTLVIVGSLDAATPPQMVRELADAIDGSQFVELEGLAHAPMAQAPDVFMDTISEFLGLRRGIEAGQSRARR